VPYFGDNIHFDYLTPGSCFAAYSSFSEDMLQIMTYKAKTLCVIESIKASHVVELSKIYLELRDVLKELEIELKSGAKTSFDLFRFFQPKTRMSKVKRGKVRRKFRDLLVSFINNYRRGLAKKPMALVAIGELQE
jgi:hypothetical protein